ncbi:hypothetical protein EYC80_006065 [Monilinia laxa]|uniref:Uncharacterized protein n=1 Tax=Monilinia laxa TaxID=61186 RepID=A0A5N6KG03_MONLA|nr:hypothetical protein EYC80_006065 [Monilinia laxa]
MIIKGIRASGSVNNESELRRPKGTLPTTMSAQRSCQKSLMARRMSTYIPGHQDRNHWAGDDDLLCNLYQAYYSWSRRCWNV